MTTSFKLRTRALRRAIARANLDALLVTQPPNWYYLTGFTGEAGLLLAGPKMRPVIVTDGRFMVQAREETAGVPVVQQVGGLLESAGKLLQEQKVRTVGYDPEQVTVAQLRNLRKAAGGRVRWTPVSRMVETLRMNKDASELAHMRRAALLASEVVAGVAKVLRPGLREFEVAAEIEYHMRKRGSSGPAFETIVASGARTALPHARPTARRLGKNELVVLDLG